MRIPRGLFSSGLLLFGLTLATALLYDATAITRLADLDPAGQEAAVAVAGLAASTLAVTLGARLLLRESHHPTSADTH